MTLAGLVAGGVLSLWLVTAVAQGSRTWAYALT